MKTKNVLKIAAVAIVMVVAFLNVDLVSNNNPNEKSANAVASLNFAAAQGEVWVIHESNGKYYYCCDDYNEICGSTGDLSSYNLRGRSYNQTYPEDCSSDNGPGHIYLDYPN